MSVAVLDPAEVAIGRDEFDIDDPQGAIRVQQAGLDWGDAAIQAFLADLRTGSVPLDYRIPNRTIKVPLGLGMDDSGLFDQARRMLQAKVGLFQREGGWLRRQLLDGSHVFADVINATLTLPDKTGEAAGLEDNVVLQLECLPDFYGDEITLDPFTGSGGFAGVLKAAGVQAQILGDHPGRCRIVLTNGSTNNQQGVYWGFRSRHYDPAVTAALVYEAEAMTPLDVASVVTLAGASGGQVVQHANLSAGVWVPVMQTTLASGAANLTHRGTYRVRARVYSPSNTPALRLLWAAGDIAHVIANDQVRATDAGDFYIVDLGTIRLDPPPISPYYWKGVIQAMAVANGDDISIDRLFLQPLDESSGWAWCAQVDQPTVSGTAAGDYEPGLVVDDSGYGTVAWNDPWAAAALDYAVASADLQSAYSHYLKATQFGFNIPTGAVISGIQVAVHRSSPRGNIYDAQVSLVKAGAIQTPNKAKAGPWPGYNAYDWAFFGGETDLWGGTWTPADVNAATFGMALAAYSDGVWDFSPSPGPGKPGTWQLDPDTAQVSDIQITVYYTTGGSYSVQADSVLYASRQAEIRFDGSFRQDATGTVWAKMAEAGGDYPRIPPSGPEGRPVELLTRLVSGDSTFEPLEDPTLGSATVQVKYRPCYLFRP